ncbi:hypothetical protein DFR26_0732 [Paraperlucidibaca baekdonensis]|uniref:Uncharacterized protein n=1 Tax=Paraperlucidibaca baekdonensis TaxID=748120 RepID=A0A3E0HA02_9GAMM|nr:hypothetical protein [Paraperlucidibaca baekdonensis]REH40531.1 hypothetical protein DFR26_0732 [Paraperlucidibaca baekdonensis]
MSYDYFLLYLSAGVGVGVVLGLILLVLAYKNRIALRSLLSPIRYRRTPALVKPVALDGTTTTQT